VIKVNSKITDKHTTTINTTNQVKDRRIKALHHSSKDSNLKKNQRTHALVDPVPDVNEIPNINEIGLLGAYDILKDMAIDTIVKLQRFEAIYQVLFDQLRDVILAHADMNDRENGMLQNHILTAEFALMEVNI
jgi:hypothetical protein